MGEGNFHLFTLLDKSNSSKVENFQEKLTLRAKTFEGTYVGHGIGLGKRQYLVDELGTDTVNLMQLIKKALDPHSIMNPEKMFLS